MLASCPELVRQFLRGTCPRYFCTPGLGYGVLESFHARLETLKVEPTLPGGLGTQREYQWTVIRDARCRALQEVVGGRFGPNRRYRRLYRGRPALVTRAR